MGKLSGLNEFTGHFLQSSFTSEPSQQGWNQAVQKCPKLIVHCRKPQDVQNAIRWARQHKVPMQIYNQNESYNIDKKEDCTLAIELGEMNAIQLEPATKRLQIQGGVTNRQLYHVLKKHAYPFASGTSLDMQVSQDILSGRWGYASRFLGLGCNWLVELELIDYAGRYIRANAVQNSDLFWACRGAGGENYGVIVSMTFALPEPIEKVTKIQIRYLKMSRVLQEQFLQEWQNWLATADTRATLLARISSTKETTNTMIEGLYFGSPDQALLCIQPFLNLRNAQFTLRPFSFAEAAEGIIRPYMPDVSFEIADRYVLKRLGAFEISQIPGLLQKKAEGSIQTTLSLYAMGGEIARMRAVDTSFFYREALYRMRLETTWQDKTFAKANIDWMDERFRYLASLTMEPYVSGGSRSALHARYCTHLARLRDIKEKYDPYKAFVRLHGMHQSHLSMPSLSDFMYQPYRVLSKYS